MLGDDRFKKRIYANWAGDRLSRLREVEVAGQSCLREAAGRFAPSIITKQGQVMFKKIVFILSVSIAASAQAGGSSTGRIVDQLIGNTGVAMFSAGVHQSKPACSTVGDAWAFDVKTPAGAAMYSFLLSAYAQGKTINVVGTGNCDIWGDRESVAYLTVQG